MPASTTPITSIEGGGVGFDYHRPDRVEAAAALAAAGGRILAGGQSLMPLVKQSAVAVDALVDINRLPGLDKVTAREGWVEIGALARLEAVRLHPLVALHLPLLKAALAWVANPGIRGRGTLVGNLVQNGPGAEAVAAAALAEAQLVCLMPGGGTRIAHIGDLPERAFVVAVRLRASPSGTLSAFHEIQKRFGHLCTVGCGLDLLPGGRVRAVLAGLAAAPLICPAIASALAAGMTDDASILDALELDLEGRTIRADLHATASYRRDVAPVAVRRAFAAAGAGGMAP